MNKTPERRKMHAWILNRTFSAIVLLMMMAGAVLAADEPALTDAMKQRAIVSMGDPARIDAVLAKARRGEPICVVSIGGSITAGGLQTKDPARRYSQQLAKWFETTFPGLKVRFVNAGIGATDSAYAALRVKRDVLDQHPDLVVVEFAVNDPAPPQGKGEGYEGLLRQLLSSSKDLAVIELFFMHKDGKSAQQLQVDLGRHYGLPMISFTDAMWPEFQSGRLKWETFYADVVHPNNEGHDVASQLLGKFLSDSLAKMPAPNQPLPQVANLPAPLITDTYEHCFLFRGQDFKPITAAGWTHTTPNFWECSPTGGTLECEIPGKDIFLNLSVPAAAAKSIDLGIDGAQPVPTSKFYKIATGLTPGMHKVKVIVHPYPPGADPKKDAVKLWWGGGAGCPR